MEAKYESGRKKFILEGCSGMGVFTLTTGAFIAGFCKHLGASDELNGIIGAIATLTCFTQLFSYMIFEKLNSRKKLTSSLCLIFRLLLGLMFILPLIAIKPSFSISFVIIFYFTAYAIAAFVTPATSAWIVDLVPGESRGGYFAKKDAWSLAFITVLSPVMGLVLDYFRKSDNESVGFMVLGGVVIILACFNFFFMSTAYEPVEKIKKSSANISVLFKVLKDKEFRKVIFLFIFWNIALQIAGPYFAVYMVSDLSLSYSYIMILGVISSVSRVLSVKIWGRIADKKGWNYTTALSIAALGVLHFTWFFVDKRTAIILLPILHLIGGVIWGGISIALFNIQFVYAPEVGKTAYIGLSAALGGILGFTSTYLGGRILNLLPNCKFSLLSVTIGNIQVLFMLSGILLGLTSLFIKKRFA